MEPDAVGGLFDWLIFNNIKVYKDVTAGDLLKLFNAAKSKDIVLIRAAVVNVASHAGYAMDADELDDVAEAVLAQNVGASVYQIGDYAMKFAVQHLGYVPAVPHEPIRMMDRKSLADMTAAECSQWFGENKPQIRKEAGCKVAKLALRKIPEVQEALAGNAAAVAKMKALDPDEVIKWLNRAILALTVASAFYPPLIVVVTALKMILARYEANHPDLVGLSLDELAS